MTKPKIIKEAEGLTWKKTGKALAVAVISSALTFLIGSLNAGKWIWDWKGMLLASITGAISFVSVTWFDPKKT